jgi:integrase/recombinase XerD
MTHRIHRDIVVSRRPTGPLADSLGEFATWAAGQGYARYSRYRQVLLAAEFSRWLGRHHLSARHVLSVHVSRYLRARRRRAQRHRSDAGALRQFVRFLREQGVVPTERIRPRRQTPVERMVEDFEAYLSHERGLARLTGIHYASFVRRFLTARFGARPVTLARVAASDVIRFVQREASRLQPKGAKVMTAALRSFLRYAQARGHLARDLTGAVPTVAQWSMPAIPRAIPAAAVRQVLAAIDRQTPIGRRDYAILLLLARLGVRAGEVARLELDDVDWTTGQLCVRGKGGTVAALPLPADVGAAMAAYLRHGRPTHSSRRVFLRARAPVRGFVGVQAITSIVRQRVARAGVTAPTMGAHQFRHALATELLRQGASLSEIGEVLRHRSVQTTAIYTKVDLTALRTLALPWPGGAR